MVASFAVNAVMKSLLPQGEVGDLSGKHNRQDVIKPRLDFKPQFKLHPSVAEQFYGRCGQTPQARVSIEVISPLSAK
jgi:hypothetical protein